ncbi:MAG: porin [Rhodoferax sp.]|uniref:porin n=1 Tax=Rhodoferax sp. TaxID=50421 RepID=UPI0027352D7C|nr:porin [Rhodoferax sp.]MDP2677541.1 porin [Rhodoferax sp.]
MSHKLTPVALIAMALYASGACAEETGAPMFSFSGFGTLGVVHSSEDKADFTSSFFKPNGAGYSHSWSADVDSLIGGQVTANLTPRLSAILQVISEQNYDTNYRPHVEWANIKYQFTPDISVRVGRIVLPAFLFSDTLKVGYATPWVRPPVEVYQLLPVTHSDGADASYRLHFGKLTNTVQFSIGKNDTTLTNNGGYAKARGSWGIVNTAEYGPLTVRFTYQKTNLTVESLNPLFDSFRQFGPEGIAIADKYDPANKPFPFRGIGASYDPGSWFIMGEWGAVESHSVRGKAAAWYVSGGYRLGNVIPYVTYAQINPDNLSDPGLNVSTLPPSLAGPATSLNTALNSLLSSKPSQRTVSVGGRWDFMKNTALKLQYDHTRIEAGSIGILTNIQPGFQLGGKINMFSATIDFVF